MGDIFTARLTGTRIALQTVYPHKIKVRRGEKEKGKDFGLSRIGNISNSISISTLRTAAAADEMQLKARCKHTF